MADSAVSKIRVMLIDDNPRFLRVTADFLERHADLVVVGAVSSGEEALACLRELEPHVVLLDLALPGLGGLETIGRLRALGLPLGIVVLTVFDDSAYRRAVFAAGADGYVPKSVMYTDLPPTIRRIVWTAQGAGNVTQQPVLA